MHTEAAFDDADLNGFVDDRMEPSRAAALRASLAADPEARARLDTWRRQSDSLRALFAPVLSEPVPLRLLPAPVAASPPTGGGVSEDVKRARGTAGALATAGLGILLVGFALGALASYGTDGFGLRPARGAVAGDDLASRAVEAHRAFIAEAARPARSPRSDEEGQPRSRPGRRAPDLARQGWTYLGSHTVPGRSGPSVFLVYGSGAERLGLLIAPGGGGDGRTAEAGGGVSLGVATFGDDTAGYALTSNLGRDWLDRNLARLSDSVRAQTRIGD